VSRRKEEHKAHRALKYLVYSSINAAILQTTTVIPYGVKKGNEMIG
jgi:hypothetical protein